MPDSPKFRDIPAVIFAGGKSSRMGRDKALLPFGACDTLSRYQYERLGGIFENVYFSAKEKKFGFDAPLITDRFEESSPLNGLISVLKEIEGDACFILSVDAPFVGEEEIEALYGGYLGGKYDAVIARSPGGTHPLCGIYSKDMLPVLSDYRQRDIHRLNAILAEAETLFVDFPDDAPFANLNRPEQYEEALRKLDKSSR